MKCEYENKQVVFEQYRKVTHIIGKIVSAVAFVLLVGAPFLIGYFLGAFPNLTATFKSFISVGLVWTVTSIVEFLVYTPMLGSGGSYLAFITGNLINMKIPCAVNARDIAEVKAGTPENEIISTLSIATSSLVTITVIAAGVFLIQPITPILQSETLAPAFDNVVPALFGAMAFKYFCGNMKIVWVPLVLMTSLFIFVPSLSASKMIIPSGGISILVAYILFKKEKKTEANSEEEG